MTPDKIEVLVEEAILGDKPALELVLKEIQGFIYRLTLRMLWNPTDAEDATQEILIKVIQNIKRFKRNSKFTTWVYRITINYLINEKQKKYSLEKSYKSIIKELESNPGQNVIEQYRDYEDMKLGCSYAMLLSLDKNHRIAFILHYIFELSGEEGSEILEITPTNYRKRVSRAKEKLLEFMSARCNLINKSKVCKCQNVLAHLVEQNFITPQDTKKLRIEFGKNITDKKLLENANSIESLALIYKESAHRNHSKRRLHPKIKKLLSK